VWQVENMVAQHPKGSLSEDTDDVTPATKGDLARLQRQLASKDEVGMAASAAAEAVNELLTEKIGGLATQLGALQSNIERLEGKVEALEAKVNGLDRKVDAVEARIESLGRQLDAAVERIFSKLEQSHTNHETRLSKVEELIRLQ
jgi:chromosome segregation ATPase